VAGAGRVLIDRAVAVEDALEAAGLTVHGWLSATQLAQLLRDGFDPAARSNTDPADDAAAGEELSVAAAMAGPTAMVDQWSAVRHGAGWSTTLQVIRPPSRPATGDVLQHLLIGIPARRRMSLLYVPTSMHVAERRAHTEQLSTEAEEAFRARWGFATSARHRRAHTDAAVREAELVDGRAVYRAIWLITVTAADPAALDAAVGQVDAAARQWGGASPADRHPTSKHSRSPSRCAGVHDDARSQGQKARVAEHAVGVVHSAWDDRQVPRMPIRRTVVTAGSVLDRRSGSR